MSLHDRLYRLVMRALPAEFRADYAGEMESHFRAERRDAVTTIGLMRLWLSTLTDVLRTAPAEHFDVLSRDLSYAWRMLQRRPALACAVVVTLAIGIGANTAIFSVVNSILLAPLPYPDADRVVTIEESQPEHGRGRTGYYSFDTLRSRQQSFDRVAAAGSWGVVLRGDGQEPERVGGLRVTSDYFRVLGITPALGRGFEAADDTPAGRRVLLLSDALWRRRFHADAAVIGKPVQIGTATFTIVGVLPAGLNDVVSQQYAQETEIFTPLGYTVEAPSACRSCRHLNMIGLLKPSVTVDQAASDASRVYQSLTQEFPRDYSASVAVVTRVRDRVLGPVRPALLLLWSAVGVLLLIACANIANLLLIRASEREEEIAIRRALGVSPQRLMRQLLTESMLLALVGGAVGTVFAAWVTHVLVANAPSGIPRVNEITVSATVLLYAMAASVVTGLIFGMAPARMLFARIGGGPATVLTNARTTAGPAAWRHRAWLIGGNVALSTVLLVSSGLLVRSFVTLLKVDPGFSTDGVLTMGVELSGANYESSFAYGTPEARAQSASRIAAFYDNLDARLASLPGVAAVGASTSLPLTGYIDRWSIWIEGRPGLHPEEEPEADRYGVQGNYFSAMGIPLLRGRLFTENDGAGAPPVVVIGKTMADKLWPGEDPIGQRVRLAGGPNNPPRTIIGIVGDVHHNGLERAVSYQAYMPQVQAPWSQSDMTMIIKAKPGIDPLTLAAAARQQVRDLDPQQPVVAMRTYESIASTQMATRRFSLGLVGSFAMTALLLAVVGLYGALSYVVTQRQREIGVRVALGAASTDIRRLVMTQGLQPVWIGIAAGVLIAAATSQLLSRMLYGVTATDAVTYAATLATMMVSANAACLLPARRAAGVQPAVALRA